MKLCILSDTQYGSRNNYLPFLELNRKFFQNIFWHYLQEHNIKVIVHLGDLVEKRKEISYLTASYLREDFLLPAVHGGYYLHWLLGNHDIYFRETTQINAASILDPGRIWKYKRAVDVVFDGTPILFVPWICKENLEHSLQIINDSKSKALFGHLELQGFEMAKGLLKKEGMDANLLKKFEIVLTGHYHHRSIKDNIYYVGSHAEFTWADYGDEHGFHIFDTETLDVEFIRNPYTVFAKVWYDENKKSDTDFSNLTGKIVKVIVSSKTNQERYEHFISQIENAQPLDIQVVEDHLNLDLVEDESLVPENMQSTLDIMRAYVKQANNVVPVEKLDKLIVELYNQAQENE